MWVDPGMQLHWGSGNIDVDPDFVDVGYWDNSGTPSDPCDDFFVGGNFHLMVDSLCGDVGDNSRLPAESVVDIDGEERLFNGTVDIGADEIVTNIFDLADDGIVDYADLAVLADEWLIDTGELETDFKTDGTIDFLDFAEFANQWYWRGGWYQ